MQGSFPATFRGSLGTFFSNFQRILGDLFQQLRACLGTHMSQNKIFRQQGEMEIFICDLFSEQIKWLWVMRYSATQNARLQVLSLSEYYILNCSK
jgi:hypothetical protein